MSISPRLLALAATIAATLTGGIVAAGTAHADSAPVTGTINRSGVIGRTGPGNAYREVGTITGSYDALCATPPQGSMAPPRLPAASAVWVQIADSADAAAKAFGEPSQQTPVGYVTADALSLTQNGKAVTWTALPPCPTPPPPDGKAVSAIPPGADKPTQPCQQGVLDPGPHTLVFSSEQNIDIEFDAAVPMKVEVTDVDTEKEASHTLLPATGSTPHGSTAWHFTEKANGTGVTPHRLNVTIEGAVGGPNAEGGEFSEGDVAYTVRSMTCGEG